MFAVSSLVAVFGGEAAYAGWESLHRAQGAQAAFDLVAELARCVLSAFTGFACVVIGGATISELRRSSAEGV